MALESLGIVPLCPPETMAGGKCSRARENTGISPGRSTTPRRGTLAGPPVKASIALGMRGRGACSGRHQFLMGKGTSSYDGPFSTSCMMAWPSSLSSGTSPDCLISSLCQRQSDLRAHSTNWAITSSSWLRQLPRKCPLSARQQSGDPLTMGAPGRNRRTCPVRRSCELLLPVAGVRPARCHTFTRSDRKLVVVGCGCGVVADDPHRARASPVQYRRILQSPLRAVRSLASSRICGGSRNIKKGSPSWDVSSMPLPKIMIWTPGGSRQS